MSLNLSQTERTKMLARWFDRIVDGYPAETARFLRDQSDPFANPVGAALRDELAPIFDAILDPIWTNSLLQSAGQWHHAR